jgi:hypothetical protein
VRPLGPDDATQGLGDGADYGYCASHSRFFWGFRLHARFALDGTPRALALIWPKIDEKSVCLQLIARCQRQPGQVLIVVGDKNFCGASSRSTCKALDATIHRPRRKTRRAADPIWRRSANGSSRSSSAQRHPGLERHCARELHQLRVRLACRFAALAAAIALNTASAAPAARWPATPTNPVAQLI